MAEKESSTFSFNLVTGSVTLNVLANGYAALVLSVGLVLLCGISLLC